MKRLQAYQYELKPNGEQQRNMRRFAGSCRFVFNKALAMQKALYEQGENKLGYAGLCKALTAWRNSEDTAWLAHAPVHPLQQTLKDLEQAYTNFFAKRADFPRFKKKGMGDSLRYPDARQFKIDAGNSRVFLPKLGWLRYRNSRDILGTARNITVSNTGGKWFVSIQTEREIAEPVHPSTSIIGIDVCITRFATLSDGTVFEPIDSLKKQQARLARYQRAMSRKTKFSNNWKKAKAKVTKLHQKIGNIRSDYLHKTTTTISQNHAMVCIEDLQVRNMSKSAAGSAEAPKRRDATSRPSRDSTSRFSIKAGSSSAGNWSTSRHGEAVRWWRSIRATPVALALAAAMYRQRIARHKPALPVWSVATRTTPIWSVRSIS